MSYEPELPPVPTRAQELETLTNIEDDFINQSYGKYYMNESLRINKLEFSEKLNEYKRRWYGNLFLGKQFKSSISIQTRYRELYFSFWG